MSAADLAIIDADIVTMDGASPRAEALATKDGRIIAVGRDEDISRLVEDGTEVVDAQGRMVLPGFIDCHIHLGGTGLDMLQLDLSGCRRIEELLRRVSERVRTLSPGQWLVGRAYNEFDLDERRPPTLDEIDRVSPDNPVWISRSDLHSGVLNGRGLELMKIPANVKGVDGNGGGRPIGVIREDANSFVRAALNLAIDPLTRRTAVRAACDRFLASGLTSIHALEGGSLFSDDDVEALMVEMPGLPIRVRLFHQITDVARVKARGLKQIGGCLMVDGSFGSHTAALLEPYSDERGGSGVLYFHEEELEAFVRKAHHEGLQITVHAIGDAAIEQILSAYERTLSDEPRADHRHRIEHICLPSREQIDRCVKAGIVFSMQPAWAQPIPQSVNMWMKHLGPTRMKRLLPLRSVLEAGGAIIGGSDSPVSPAVPLLGIEGAVTHFNEAERISRMQALSLYTTQAAWASFEEDQKGRIAPGYLADLVVLGEDLFAVPEEKIGGIPIEMTIVGGQIRYKR